MRTWQLQEAKSKFSEVINLAVKDSPQQVTRNGKIVAYVVSADTWDKEHKPSIKDVLLSRPHKETELDLVRNREIPRELDL